MEAVHQGYLLCNVISPHSNGDDGAPQKVYVVMTHNELICYSENPAQQNFSKVHVVSSMSLKSSKVLDSTDSRNPKSFELVSTRDNSRIEFACPTNSVKFQWMKQLQVQTCAAVPTAASAVASESKFTDKRGMDERQQLSTVSRVSPTRNIATSTPPVSKLTASRNLAAKVLTPVPRISYNTSMLDHSTGASNGHHQLDSSGPQSKSLHSTGQSQELGNSGKFVAEEMPKWIPGNFGNNKHSSLALSPSPPRSRSAGRVPISSADNDNRNHTSNPGPAEEFRFRDSRNHDREATAGTANPVKGNVSRQRGRQSTTPADYDVLNSRAVPTRPASVNAVPRQAAARSPRSSTAQAQAHSRRAQEAAETERTPTLRTTQSTPRERRGNAPEYSAGPSPAPAMDLMAKSMNSMTVAEIKAALMNMPDVVRHSLMDVNTPSSTYGGPENSQSTRSHPRRDRDRVTPAQGQSASRHLSHNNSSVTEYYNSHRKEGERYEHFMGEGYPAVGEFYPYEDGEASGAEISSADESSEHDQIGDQEGSFADSSYLDGTEDAQVYRPATRSAGRAGLADSRTESEFDEEADGYGAYSSEQQYSDRDFHRSSRRQTAPAVERRTDAGASNHQARGRSVKPQLPQAARRASVTSSGAESESPRGSGIPRPVKSARAVEEPPLARKASHRQDSTAHRDEASRKQDQGRARSAQRLPTGRASRDTPAQAQEEAHRSSSANTADRPRYLNEPERREAVEWSRKQAWEKKIRSDFSGSPLRSASPGNAPPLKLKYRSFHNSLEKVDEGDGGDRANRGGGAKQPRLSAGRQSDPAAVSEAVGRHRATEEPVPQPAGTARDFAQQARPAARAQSPPRSSCSKKPESFFDFKQNRAGSNGRPSQAAGGARSAVPPSREQDSDVPLPSKSVSPGRSHRYAQAATDAEAVQGRPDGRTAHGAPAARPSANENVTNVAEWRRLTEWLARIDMSRYVDVLKANGITKLSLVELMQPSDMRQIGIDAQDIPVILNNVNEFTNRTRSFSEQVLNKPVSAASSPTNSYESAPRHQGAGLSAPAAAAVAPSVSVLHTKKAIGPPPMRPLFVPQAQPQVQEGSAPPNVRTKPLKPPYSSVLARSAAAPIVPAEQRPSRPAARPIVAPLVIDGDAGASKGGVDEHIFSDMDEIINELYRCFECGERELFFHAWKQAALYMPDDCLSLNPARPAMFNARQVIEFHLHLHFAVYPITHHQGKKAEKLGKLALQRYLESVMLTSELDSFNHVLPVKTFSPTAKGADISASEEDILRMNTTISSFPSPSSGRPFTRTREYAIYAGIVLVPEPEQNVAFQGLFQPHWMESLKERLRQFLQLVRPHVEIISTVASSVVGDVDAGVEADVPADASSLVGADEAKIAPTADLASDAGSSVRSGREKVRKYLHAKDLPPEVAAPATPGGLDDFGIAFSSPEAPAKDEGGLISPAPVPVSVPLPVLEEVAPVVDAPLAAPASPEIASVSSKRALVPPLELAPAPAPAPAPAEEHVSPTVPRDSEESRVGRISRIASPVSPVSSVISQLTDDSPRPSAPAAGAVLSPVTPNSTERKGKPKPFGASNKAGMQSQVDSYNKLLRHGAAVNTDSSDTQRAEPVNQASIPAPTTRPAEPAPAARSDVAPVNAQPPKAAAVTRRASAQPAGNRAPSLNLGFGMKRRSASDASAPSQSLAAQVAKYNKLLLSKNETEGAVGEAGQGSSLQSASQEEEAAEEISPAQAQQVADVLVEMQDIYETQTQDSGRRASTFFVDSEGLAERHAVAPLAE